MASELDELDDLRQRLSADHNEFLTQTRLRLARLARARGVAPDAIEDVVQETLVEAWTHLDRLTAPVGFSAWIDEICRNICRRAAYRRARDVHRLTSLSLPHQMVGADSGEEALSQLAVDVSSDTSDPLDAIYHQDLTSLLDRALGVLSPAARTMVELCHLLEVPHAEVASRLGITVGALDTRLHRARRLLYQALGGPLREEAAALGLALDEAQSAGWRETRLWCPLCARRRLQGYFITFDTPAKGPNLHLRCPDCARRYGQDTVHSMGLVSLSGLQSFRPAWKRIMQGLTERVMKALSDDQRFCLYCGNPALVRVAGRDTDTTLARGPYPFWIQFHCPRCGEENDASGGVPSVDQLVYWSHPVTRQFLLRHSRSTSVWREPVERDGAVAIPIELTDMESADRLTVLAERRSLRILAVS